MKEYKITLTPELCKKYACPVECFGHCVHHGNEITGYNVEDIGGKVKFIPMSEIVGKCFVALNTT